MKHTLVIFILLFSLNISASQRLNVRDFGAVGDGITKDTKAFQEAITQGAKDKRIVYIPEGEYYIGPLKLFSNTSIELSDFAVIKGSTDTIDYKCSATGKKLALLNADGANHIRISGRGIIEGNGDAPQFKTFNGDKRDHRPNLLVFNESSDIEIRDLTMKNSAAWMQHYYMCKGLRLFNLTVYNHVNMNNDGIDIDNCYDVVVSGCIVDSDDDAFCLKSTDNEGICQNITLTNCILASNCNAIKLGTESLGGFKQIAISNVSIKKTSARSFGGRDHGLGGIVLDLVDGGEMNGVTISNITMTGVVSPLFIRLGNRGRKVKNMKESLPAGVIRNIRISDVTAIVEPSTHCAVITGIPGHYIENLQLSNIQFYYEGGGKLSGKIDTGKIPELEANYPEATMFGSTLPVFGLFVRHVNGMQINGVSIWVDKADNRCSLLFDDAHNVQANNLMVNSKTNEYIGIYSTRSENCSFENLIHIKNPKRKILKVK